MNIDIDELERLRQKAYSFVEGRIEGRLEGWGEYDNALHNAAPALIEAWRIVEDVAHYGRAHSKAPFRCYCFQCRAKALVEQQKANHGAEASNNSPT